MLQICEKPDHLNPKVEMIDKSETFNKAQVARFWKKVDIRGPDECWPWLASKGKPGYGHVHIRPKHYDSHRMAYMITKGAVAPKMLVLHSCPEGDRRDCCNPAHLRQGTYQDNVHDALIRGAIKLKVTTAVAKLIASTTVVSPLEELKMASELGLSTRYIRAIRHGHYLSAITGLKPRPERNWLTVPELQAAMLF